MSDLTALVAFFKVDFGLWHTPQAAAAAKKTGVSTSPLAPVTGWSQCTLPLDKVLPIEGRDEVIHGRFKVTSSGYGTKEENRGRSFAVKLNIFYQRKPNVKIAEERTYGFCDPK